MGEFINAMMAAAQGEGAVLFGGAAVAALSGIFALAVVITAFRISGPAFGGLEPIRLQKFHDAVLLAFLAVSAMFIGFSSARVFYNAFGEESAMAVFAPTIIMQVCVVAAVLLFKKFADSKFKLFFVVSRKAAVSFVLFSVLSVLAVLSLNSLIVQTYFIFEGEYPPKQEVVDIFLSLGGGWKTVVAVFSVLVLAPLAEEMFFRGVLYRIFKWAFSASRFGAIAAAVLSGVLFALIHADAYVFVPLALMGVFLCMAYEKGGSILSPILVHAAFNALNVGIVWFAK